MTHHKHEREHEPRTATEELTEEAEHAARDVTRDGPRPKKGDALTPNTEAQESTGEDDA
ncbi:hypothetical protein [Streptomyces sp. B1I3]|uniref:hypothetical protein n=1 Tax=Streptomyces sp. B1I3 TaxID=3042264 RepID=UPI002783F8A1|nr:hypothetical protein [Streptomyces sp. B1I3]MDQ0797831.1 hypothetical protein [Streptomyces sp. B1I3]